MLATLAALLAACQPIPPPDRGRTPAGAPAAIVEASGTREDADPALPTSSQPPTGAPASGARASRFVPITACPVIVSRPEEAGYRVTECDAPAGYGLRVSEADGRFNLLVRAPGATDFTSLRLPELGGGGFSRLGERVEWRGIGAGEAFVPDVLVVRYIVASDPSDPARETSQLVIARLGAPGPCVAARVPAGDTQSDDARALADAAPPCNKH